MKEDLIKVFEEFFINGKTCKSMNSIFITLILKKDKSRKAFDLGPISLMMSVYKVIVKILSLRFSDSLDKTISIH